LDAGQRTSQGVCSQPTMAGLFLSMRLYHNWACGKDSRCSCSYAESVDGSVESSDSWYITDGCRVSPLSQDSSFEDKLIPHREVCNLQVLQQLIHNVTHVLVVAHGEQQVQASPPDADVSVLQRSHDALLMPAPFGRAQLLEQCMDRCQDNACRETWRCSAVLPMHAFKHVRANAPPTG